MRVFQQTIGKAFILEGFLFAQYTGHQTRHGIDDGDGRQLAAGQNKVTQRDFVCYDLFDQSFVDPFIVAAKEQ